MVQRAGFKVLCRVQGAGCSVQGASAMCKVLEELSSGEQRRFDQRRREQPADHRAPCTGTLHIARLHPAPCTARWTVHVARCSFL